ncbi:MAG: MBL fold metallo-hydrolase [Victivallales bacterium]|nr:MBL fold metallo-hydrolase [Victivallales bacterium]
MFGTFAEVVPGLYVDEGSCLAGILVADGVALVINPGNPGLAARLRTAGVQSVEQVLFTHHRRELADGFPELWDEWSPEVVVPEAERELFAAPDAYWQNPESRWRLLCGHVPYHVTHANPVPVSRGVGNGDAWEWHGWRLEAVATPGYTDGAVSYIVRGGGRTVVFAGDLVFAPGMVRDFYCLQHGNEQNGQAAGDYHGFLGSMETVLASLRSLPLDACDALVPAHGEVMGEARVAIDLLDERFRAAYRNYSSISAFRWYYPEYFSHLVDQVKLLPEQETAPPPESVVHISGTTWALVADNGRALLVDVFRPGDLAAARQLVEEGRIAGYDGIWVTHYHHDHVEMLAEASLQLDCPVMTDQVMAPILECPGDWFLTCLSPHAVQVDWPTADGETWRWENYSLTAYHFPGQTYYHSGLYVAPDAGPSLFFAGDAFTPTGVDDYCSWNRNWLGADVGLCRCIRLLRELDPEWIFNQHVEVGFRFSEDAYEQMLETLAEREELFGVMLPWEHPNFGTDEYWVHTWPYEQDAEAADEVRLEVRLHNHADEMRDAWVMPRVPDSWEAVPEMLRMPCRPGAESVAVFALRVPADQAAAKVVVPVRIEFGGQDLGTFREAIVNVL